MIGSCAGISEAWNEYSVNIFIKNSIKQIFNKNNIK